MSRDLTRPVPFAQATRAVFDLALEGMVWSRRSLVVGLMVALPAVLALVYRIAARGGASSEVSPLELYGIAVAFYWVRNALPLVALFFATALIADEVEGKTITYLLTRPVGRSAILAGKFLAYLATTLSLALPAAVVTFFLLATARGLSGISYAVTDLAIDLSTMTLALLVYGALFTLLGILLRRPTIPGLLFLFIWELIANLPGYLPRFTITAWLRSLIRHRPADEGLAELFGQALPAGEALAVLGVLTVVFLGLAFWIFGRREYVLEQ
jgi:ABC-2 type transport system permease protein